MIEMPLIKRRGERKISSGLSVATSPTRSKTDLSTSSLLGLQLVLILAIGCSELCPSVLAEQASSESKLVERCCQIGRERAIESAGFNCKLSAREALQTLGRTSDRASQLLARSAEKLLAVQQTQFSDKCEMVLESCCLAHHRERNCNSGKQFAKSGSACMDVELSKEATVATESFNDCCMSCSLGILAAKSPQNDTSSIAAGQTTLSERCKLISPLASSLAGQLYEQTYAECCQENLPKASGALIDASAPIDCQRPNACSQRCLPAGTLDPLLHRRVYRDRCECFSGYKLAQDGVSCVDIDECKLNLHTCNRHSEVCDNTRGSYKCLARATWQQGPI